MHSVPTALPLDAPHPAWCSPAECYLSPFTGCAVHAYVPPPAVIDGTVLTLTMVRHDTADGPGVTRAYVESINEREGTVLTVAQAAETFALVAQREYRASLP